MKLNQLLLLVVFVVACYGCTTTQAVNQQGSKLAFQQQTIVVGQTNKRQLTEMYGKPTSNEVVGKYERMKYEYKADIIKSDNTGTALTSVGLLGALVPGVGGAISSSVSAATATTQVLSTANTVSTAYDVTKVMTGEAVNSNREFQKLEVLLNPMDGTVVDYFYIERFENILKGGDESTTLLLQANEQLRQGKTQDAINMLEQSIKLNPKNYRSLNMLAWTLADLNIDIDKALNYSIQAVEIFPDSPYNNGTLGTCYFKKGDNANAEKYLTIAVDLFPVYAPTDAQARQSDKARLELVKSKKKG